MKLGNRKRLAAGKTRFMIDLDIKGVVLFSTMAIAQAKKSGVQAVMQYVMALLWKCLNRTAKNGSICLL